MTLRVALVTGGSSGIGQATALELAGLGFTVYAGARRVDRMEGLSAQGVRSLSLDLTDDSSVVDAVARIEREAGRLDVLVNNAGYGSFGAVEDLPLAEGRRQFDVNVFGAMRLIQLVLPLMRRQGGGRIVNVSSVGG
jgi:NAD(P)-dependent dehydrogenase (short-subunit alcohol dehydrogenase family)